MISALAIFGGSTTLVLVGVVVWLTYRHAKANDAAMAARDLYLGQTRTADEWRHKYEDTAAKLVVVAARQQQETNLRAVAESQRNIAQARVRDLLRKHVASATNEEIQELTNEAFTTPLQLAPRAPERVPSVPRSEDPRDGLLEPDWSEVQPAKPAG